MTCADCKRKMETVTIVAPACKTYGDGNSCEATLLWNDEPVEVTSGLTYYKGETALTAAPTDAGTYRAECVINALDDTTTEDDIIIYVEYTIAPATITADMITLPGTVYTGTAQNPDIAVVANGVTLAHGTDYEVQVDPEGYIHAGDYPITISGMGNYSGSVELTFTIKKATATVTAEAKTKTYGDADPVLTYTADGLIGNDTMTGALAREEGRNVGSYAIRQGTLSAGDNYTISFISADLTITAKDVTITGTQIEALTDQAAAFEEDTVNSADKSNLQQLAQDIEDLLATANLTEDQRAALESVLEQVGDMIDTTEDAAEKILEAKKAYDGLTNHEKSLVNETAKKKLDDLVAALTAYDIVKGDGGKWTKGGSTIITLKQSFLKGLSTGEHTITVVYTDGETSGTFRILAQTSTPASGDDSNITLYGSMSVISLAALMLLLLASRKRRQAR